MFLFKSKVFEETHFLARRRDTTNLSLHHTTFQLTNEEDLPRAIALSRQNEPEHVHAGNDEPSAKDDGKHDAATDATDATDGEQDGRRSWRRTRRDAKHPTGRDGRDEEHDPGTDETSRGTDEEHDPGTDETTDGIRFETGSGGAKV